MKASHTHTADVPVYQIVPHACLLQLRDGFIDIEMCVKIGCMNPCVCAAAPLRHDHHLRPLSAGRVLAVPLPHIALEHPSHDLAQLHIHT